MKYVYTITLAILLTSAPSTAQQWTMGQTPLMTRWSSDIDPDNVLPEYPRPIMQRIEWMNLNGIWEFGMAREGDRLPGNKELGDRILVPFPWESAISGVHAQSDTRRAWYRRSFSIPKEWEGRRLLLNFGAVDWEAAVYVNGKFVGAHKGGYDPFSFEITPYIDRQSQEQVLTVHVYDPGNDKAIACGKQNNTRFSAPKGYSYCPASGIWQTVWLEPVSKEHITDIHTVPDFDNSTFHVTVSATTHSGTVRISLLSGRQTCCVAEGPAGETIALSVADAQCWTPDSPFLYNIKAELLNGEGTVLDCISSYAGMRKVSLKYENGVPRIALNNEPLFQMGPLDQGYWPDGIYTAPTDEALRWDIENIKRYGFNMIRKHVKVEPQRWYYWCDKLGILVWQDMPSCFKTRNDEEKIQFETELSNMIRTHWNHPSIVNWIVFNEHWGLYDCERITESVMKADPSRLVTGNSGIDAKKPSIDYETGHIKDNHSYRPPHVPLISSRRATVNGEYGAIGYLAEGHVWNMDGPWVHYNYSGKEAATAEYVKFIGQINAYIGRGLSAAVYTQWTDVESEMNGLYTYDRELEKLDWDLVREANLSTYRKHGQENAQTDIEQIR